MSPFGLTQLIDPSGKHMKERHDSCLVILRQEETSRGMSLSAVFIETHTTFFSGTSFSQETRWLSRGFKAGTDTRVKGKLLNTTLKDIESTYAPSRETHMNFLALPSFSEAERDD